MNIGIKNIEYYLPEKILTNNDLEKIYPDWSADKIYKKTGIMSRHIAGDYEVVSDLAYNAAVKLFKTVDKDSIDFLLLATQSPDYILPTTACILQDRLKLSIYCGALDFNLGNSAYVYGLALAKSLVKSKVAKNVLLIMAEIYTKHINKMDKSTRIIFGDGAAASLICECDADIGEFVFGTDGSGASNLIVPSGGLKIPRTSKTKQESIDENGNVRSADNLFMDGAEIFNFTIDRVPVLVKETLHKNNIPFDEINLFIFHQANAYILNYLRQKLNIPKNKFYINLKNTGNTVSASIPIAIKMAEYEGVLKKGDKVMLVGFGVGLSWGAVIINYQG